MDQPLHRGFWCGREGVCDGQDIAIVRPIRPRVRQWLARLAPSQLWR
jgi:hypothetical protein